MSAKEAYLNEVETRLQTWNATIDDLIAQVSQAQTEAKNRFRQLIQTFSDSETEVTQHLEVLRQADNLEWQEHKRQLGQVMNTLQQEIDQLKVIAQNAANGSIGWAEGLAEKAEVKSIGWTERIAKERIVIVRRSPNKTPQQASSQQH